jgi:L-amino acid N-acyltransferase YncA
MKIRSATLRDIDEIVKMGNLVDKFQVSKEVVTFWPKSILIKCMKSKTNPILVAEENEKIIGFIIANYNPNFKKAVLENIFIRKEYRRKDTGKLLLKFALEELSKLGCEYVCALCEEKNNVAIDFCIKNGFNRGINCVWVDLILNNSFKK